MQQRELPSMTGFSPAFALSTPKAAGLTPHARGLRRNREHFEARPCAEGAYLDAAYVAWITRRRAGALQLR
jgi:hypothetical protein